MSDPTPNTGPQGLPAATPGQPAAPQVQQVGQPPHLPGAHPTVPLPPEMRARAPRTKREKPARQDGGERGLSTFLKVSIILLAALTVASISLLFIGDFEGKFERVFSTFALFAVFVLFTALDTRREQKSEWYAPVALIANAYILGLLLIVIWMTPYDSFSLIWEIFWKSVFVILVTRLVILCCQLLLQMSGRMPESVMRFAFATSVLAVLAGILFTAPVGIAAFDLHIPDLYWKIATALLILTALGLSITLLLRWSYGSDAREAARAARAARGAQTLGHPSPAPRPAAPAQLGGPHGQPAQAPAAQQPQAPQQAPAQQAAPAQQQPLLPWPTFADGTPLPMGPDGQPDFSAQR